MLLHTWYTCTKQLSMWEEKEMFFSWLAKSLDNHCKIAGKLSCTLTLTLYFFRNSVLRFHNDGTSLELSLLFTLFTALQPLLHLLQTWLLIWRDFTEPSSMSVSVTRDSPHQNLWSCSTEKLLNSRGAPAPMMMAWWPYELQVLYLSKKKSYPQSSLKSSPEACILSPVLSQAACAVARHVFLSAWKWHWKG